MCSSVFRNHVQIAFRTSSCLGEEEQPLLSLSFPPSLNIQSIKWLFSIKILSGSQWIESKGSLNLGKEKYLSHEISLIRNYHFLLVWAQPPETGILKAFLTMCFTELPYIFSNHINALNAFWNMISIIFKSLIFYIIIFFYCFHRKTDTYTHTHTHSMVVYI